MRLFDETNGIKHSVRLMEPKRILILALTCLTGLCANAQGGAGGGAVPGQAAGGQQTQPDQTTTSALTPPNAIPFGTTNMPSFQTNAPPPLIPSEARKTRMMTIDECIRLALQHNLDIQIQQQNPIINQYSLYSYYGVYEPVFSFEAQQSFFDRAGGVNPQTGQLFGGTVSEQETYTPDIKGILPTGLTYDINGQAQRNAGSTISTNSFPPFWSSDASITLSQPLLRNFWIDQNRLNLQLSKATLKISEEALRLQVMTSVSAVKTAYYNLLYARGNVNANYDAYKLAEQLVSENVKRVQVGTLAPLDEKQSESQAAASLAAMQLAQQQLVVQENTLKGLLTDNYSEWADVTLIPSEQLVAVPQELNLQESWKQAVTKRPDLIEAKIKVEQQNVTLKFDFNQEFPELDVLGSYSRNANRDTLNQSLGDIEQGNRSSYSIGGQISIPLGGNYSARANYKSAKAALKQLLLSLKQTEQNIVIAVDNDVANVRSTLQQVDSTHDARVYAQAAVDAEKKKLENGKSTSFIVLQLISTLTTAEVSELQALANYNNAVTQLALDEGMTLEANHIDLKVK